MNLECENWQIFEQIVSVWRPLTTSLATEFTVLSAMNDKSPRRHESIFLYANKIRRGEVHFLFVHRISENVKFHVTNQKDNKKNFAKRNPIARRSTIHRVWLAFLRLISVFSEDLEARRHVWRTNCVSGCPFKKTGNGLGFDIIDNIHLGERPVELSRHRVYLGGLRLMTYSQPIGLFSIRSAKA